MTVFRFDKERRVLLDYRVVAVYQDGSAEVGAALSFPRAPVPTGADQGPQDDAPATDSPEPEAPATDG